METRCRHLLWQEFWQEGPVIAVRKNGIKSARSFEIKKLDGRSHFKKAFSRCPQTGI